MRSAIKTFLDIRKNRFQPFIMAEIGVREGFHLEEILSEFPNATIVAVDPYVKYYTESQAEFSQELHDRNNLMMLERAIRFFGRVIPIRLKSREASDLFCTGFFDLVYIDGDHSKDQVMLDISSWMSKVKPGGMLCGHDWDRIGEFVGDLLPGTSHDDFAPCADWWTVKK